jgi:SAM-dependent methyltransferase
MHSKAYLDRWYRSHLFGTYPSSQFNPTDLPQIIKDFFLIPNLDDELYFQNRGLEVKHFIDASHWKDYFKCNNVLEIGCGLGHRVYALRSYGVNAYGFDINKWAIENNPYSNEWFLQKDITIPWEQSHTYDLLILYDVLEHIEEDKINIALLNCFNSLLDKKHVLFSIPFLGDPNLEKDSTHKTKKSREWWIEQIQKAGFKIIEIPKHFLFNHQLIIAEKISHD